MPSAKLDLSTRDIDVGALLRTLGVAEDIDTRADSLQLALHARGNSLRELAASTALEARLVGGRISVLGAAQRPAVEILLQEANVNAGAGQPVRLRLDGILEQTPVRLQFSTGSFADFAGDSTRVPFAMAAQRYAFAGQAMPTCGPKNSRSSSGRVPGARACFACRRRFASAAR